MYTTSPSCSWCDSVREMRLSGELTKTPLVLVSSMKYLPFK